MSSTMRDSMRFALSILLVGAFALPRAGAATVTVEDGSGPMTVGSGTIVDVTRNVAGYSRLVLAGPVDVQLKRTGNEKVTVHADDNIVPLIETRVEDGKLYVDTKKNASFRTHAKLYVVVEFKQIDSVLLSGSGDVSADSVKAGIFQGSIHGSGNLKIDQLEADTVALSIAGSGNFGARGKAAKVGVVIDGSGDVNAEDLVAQTAAVSIAGSGDAHVNATESLKVRIAGSGDVRYRGSPRVDKQVAGSGDVKPLR